MTRTDLRASLVVVLAVATRRKLDKGPLLAMGDAVREAAHRDDREPGLAEIQAMNGAVEWCSMQLEAITASIRAMSELASKLPLSPSKLRSLTSQISKKDSQEKP